MDIVKRLREGRTDDTDLRWQVTDIHREAADNIEQLRERIVWLEQNVARKTRPRPPRKAISTKEAPAMTRKEKQRKSAIIAELSRMSRDGWQSSQADDYLPLERELNAINAKRGR
jgi:hypothetical protein